MKNVNLELQQYTRKKGFLKSKDCLLLLLQVAELVEQLPKE